MNNNELTVSMPLHVFTGMVEAKATAEANLCHSALEVSDLRRRVDRLEEEKKRLSREASDAAKALNYWCNKYWEAERAPQAGSREGTNGLPG